MIHLTNFLWCLVLSTTWAYADYHPKPDETWPLVAKAAAIVTGTLRVPIEDIRIARTSNKHERVLLVVKRDKVLMGDVPEEFNVDWSTSPAASSPGCDQVIALDGQEVMLFIEHGRDEPVRNFYFAGTSPNALADLDESLLKKVRGELIFQQKVLGAFDQSIPPVSRALLGKVAGLIDATTRADTQTAAFQKLEALGQEGVPAIILLMDDRRDLANPHIELRNASDHFEGIRHYGPKQVVDAMAAILNQITGENFGFIYNGDATEEDRMKTVAGWKMYLYHWKKAERIPLSEKPWREATAAIGAAYDFRQTVIVAEKLEVYQGLPHPGLEREAALREMQRKDVTKIHGYSFYTPALAVQQPEALRKLLGDPKSTRLFSGMKLCGGFHPDFAVAWESGGRKFHALISYQCREVCFLEGTREIWYDLGEGSWGMVSDYAMKRTVR